MADIYLRNAAVEVILRLPPLYVMDAILLHEQGLLSLLSPGQAAKSQTLLSNDGHNVRISEASGSYIDPTMDQATAEQILRDGDNGTYDSWEEIYWKLVRKSRVFYHSKLFEFDH